MPTETIGDRIRKARLRKGWSRQQLGEELGFEGDSARQSVYRWEKVVRSPHVDTLFALARVLGVDAAVLLGKRRKP